MYVFIDVLYEVVFAVVVLRRACTATLHFILMRRCDAATVPKTSTTDTQRDLFRPCPGAADEQPEAPEGEQDEADEQPEAPEGEQDEAPKAPERDKYKEVTAVEDDENEDAEEAEEGEPKHQKILGREHE